MSRPTEVKWDEARLARLMELRKGGYTKAECAEAMGLSYYSVVATLSRMGKTRPKQPRLTPIPATWEEIEDWARQYCPQVMESPSRSGRASKVNSVRLGMGLPFFVVSVPSHQRRSQRTRPDRVAQTEAARTRLNAALLATGGTPAPLPPRPLPPTRSHPSPRAFLTGLRAFGGRVKECQYPIGEPSDPDFRFCEAVPVSGRSYCHEHLVKCYQMPGEPRQPAAVWVPRPKQKV